MTETLFVEFGGIFVHPFTFVKNHMQHEGYKLIEIDKL